MTRHDQVRRDAAMGFTGKTFSDKRVERAELIEVIGGLQSTDDPSLVPLHEELQTRLSALDAEIEKENK